VYEPLHRCFGGMGPHKGTTHRQCWGFPRTASSFDKRRQLWFNTQYNLIGKATKGRMGPFRPPHRRDKPSGEKITLNSRLRKPSVIIRQRMSPISVEYALRPG